jgi:hypothetical protein
MITVILNYDKFLIIHVQLNRETFRTNQLLIAVSCSALGIAHYICFSTRHMHQ